MCRKAPSTMLRCFIWVMGALRARCRVVPAPATRRNGACTVAQNAAMDRNPGGAAAQNAERRAFYERIDKLGMTPLWEVLGALVPSQPKSAVAPVHFRYEE